jgi:hypothetical protein
MEQWKHQTKTWTQNPMGLVKFMFPNSNAIYLHDTPYKSLFEFDYRAFKWVYQYGQSQGTGINSKEDLNWTVEAINEAMKESRPSISQRMKSRYIFVILPFGLTILERSIL